MNKKAKSSNADPVFINANRRGFMQGAAVASGVAATGVASAIESTDAALDEKIDVASGNKGYELNDYVRRYYKRLRS